jgi:hypothetical protein
MGTPPTRTRIGTGSSKSTLNGSATISCTSTAVSPGDYVELVVGVDPGAGLSAASLASGTATLGAFVPVIDVTSAGGSGTSGSRLVAGYFPVTGAGTVTGILITGGTNGPRSGEVSVVTGADGTTPIPQSSNTTSINIATAGLDLLATACVAVEATSGAAVTASKSGTDATNWTTVASDATDIGTTGGSSASNISVAAGWFTRTSSVVTSGLSLSVSVASGVMASGILIWQAPAAGGGGTPNGLMVGLGLLP